MVCAEPDTLCSSMSLCVCIGESSLMGGRAHRTARTGPAHRDRGGDIAYENGWITREQLMESAERYGKSPYGQHLKGIADGEIMFVPNQKN